jgi:polyisoprenoid-binding protein YceI
METTTKVAEELQAPTPAQTTAIDLDISGPDVMLSGRFHDWDSGVLMGPDLDQLQVRLAIDATSSASSDALHALNTAMAPPLFTFRGRHAAPLSAGVYQVDGELTSVTGAHPLQVTVETPIEHSAVFLMSFAARKSDLGPGWTQLLSNLVPFVRRRGADDSPPMPASAWLTLPTLAAA